MDEAAYQLAESDIIAAVANSLTGSCGIPDGILFCVHRDQSREHPMAKRRKLIAKKRRKQNLIGMDFQGLLDLRDQVEGALSGYRSTLEKQLASIGGSIASAGRKVARGGRSALRGTKVAPKFRGPEGELWAGRGARPRWLVAAIKEGKKAEDFLIEKTVSTAKKRRAKK